MAISRHVQGGFADFPLIEDDLDKDKESQPREYATPRTPFHSPSQSSRSSPPPFLPSLEAVSSHFTSSTAKPKKEKTKADINAELHFQDALLALHHLRVDFDEGRMVETEIGIAADEAKKETAVGQVQQEEDEESNILDEYFMGNEEEEHGGLAKKDRGPIVEDDDIIVQSKLDTPFVEADDLDMDMGYSSSSSSTAIATASSSCDLIPANFISSSRLTFASTTCCPPYFVYGCTPHYAQSSSVQEAWIVLV
jgi:hypothetical protein